MRYLNKIIFINSANIPYGDISIDGNVHFIGTQGVGKSTILRAILFFYNADKLKLGIEKSKQTFDEYYFPFVNSYIIYEVIRDNGAFCVLAFKSQGRVAFRFIDGFYKKEHFIDSYNKAMTWDQVRATLLGTHIYSHKIDRYEQYKDIVYGNNKGQNEFRKFSIIESKQYQNLPRTIQNVFLNSKLDAEFIKQTIIMSLNEEDVKIDLSQYEYHLRDFENHLNDISQWSIKSRNGEVAVRLLADSIANSYREICFWEKEKTFMASTLIKNQDFFVNELPRVLKQLENEREKLAVENKKVNECVQNFLNKKEKIDNEIIFLNRKLNEAEGKSIHYIKINIDNIISRVIKKDEFESKKSKLQTEQTLLTSLFRDITIKFASLIEQNKNHLNEYKNIKNAEKNKFTQDWLKIKELIELKFQQKVERIETDNNELKTNAEENIKERTSILHSFEIKKQELEHRKWFEFEIAECNELINKASVDIITANYEIENGKSKIESFQKQWELDIDKCNLEINNSIGKIEVRIDNELKQISKIDSILNSQKNSLFEWLNENKPGWEQTIGKIIDQERVLFHTSLSPQIGPNEIIQQLYGIEIDLKEISTSVKTIGDYEAEIQKYQQNIKGFEVECRSLEEDREKEIEKYRRKYQPQIKELKEFISIKEYELTKAEEIKKEKFLLRDDLLLKAKMEKKIAITNIIHEIKLATAEIISSEETLALLVKRLKNEIVILKTERDIEIGQANDTLRSKIDSLAEDIKKEELVIGKLIKSIQIQEVKELEIGGADSVRIVEIEQELFNLNEELLFIEKNRNIVAEYFQHKRELFDLVDKFKSDKKNYENQLIVERNKYERVKIKLQESVEILERSNLNISDYHRQIQVDIEAFDKFCQTEFFAKLNVTTKDHVEAIKVPMRLNELIDLINQKSFAIQEKINSLRSLIMKFSGQFSPSNIFGFETNFMDETDFFSFAENLKEFLEENKIDEFERRVNERFASLITQIAKETAELVSKEATIQKVISEINRDFVDRNFAGVINSISLRLTKSANKIVVLLSEIRTFNDEHGQSIGQANLFSNKDTELNNKKAISYLKSFANEITIYKEKEVNLSDTFELQFKVVENGNDSGWVEKLTNVGSEGTDVLVKAMINIMLLNVFKDSASKRFSDFKLHCMMDEIGKLHPNNVKGILKFANDRNILLINSSPTSYNAVDYRHTYLLAKDSKNITTIKKLITNF